MSIPVDNETFLTNQLVAVEALIADTYVSMQKVIRTSQSYSFDSGQTRQSVVNAELNSLSNVLKRLYDDRDRLRSLLGLGSPGLQTRVIPGW